MPLFASAGDLRSQLYISILIDSVADHAYKANLLLRSLNDIGSIPYCNVRVYHTAEVDSVVTQEIEALGCTVRAIDRFLEGKHSNKVTQLSHFVPSDLEGFAGVLLLDIDLAFAHPIKLPDYGRVCGKVVDAANPPFAVLKRIFEAFGVAAPRLVATDWGDGATFCTNLNGGFLFVPTPLVPDVSKAWIAFARDLYDQPSLFETKEQMMFVDQISLSLALAKLALPVTSLPANFNFPAHSRLRPRSLDDAQPVTALHYHGELDSIGRVSSTNELAAATSAARRINELASDVSPYAYQTFSAHRARRRDISAVPPEVLVESIQWWEQKVTHRPKIVFHVGTPKTGTTALQRWLEANRSELKKRGVWYPHPSGASVPKHQYLVEQLITGDADSFTEALLGALSETESTTRIVLFSTEGLYNHWRDFSPRGLGMLRFLASRFAVECLICFRDPAAFAQSLYKQNLLNPNIHPCYGTDKSFEEMLLTPWFASQMDYRGFVSELAMCLDRAEITVFDYSLDIIRLFSQYLGLRDIPVSDEQHNLSLTGLGVELLRGVNKLELNSPLRETVLGHIREIEKVVGPTQFDIPESTRKLLVSIVSRPNAFLNELRREGVLKVLGGRVIVRYVAPNAGDGLGAIS